MQIIEIPTEQSTAFTDLILAVTAGFISIILWKKGCIADRKKAGIWTWTIGLLALASLIGALAHGFKMTEQTNYILWQPLNLSLGIMISLIAVAVVYDLKNSSLPGSVLPIMVGLGVVFYGITLIIPGRFIVFIVYEAVIMLFALISYLMMAFRGKPKGSSIMVSGIFVTILAAVIQAVDSLKLDFIWHFDHNGLFHIVQMLGLLILLKGLLTDFKSRAIL